MTVRELFTRALYARTAGLDIQESRRAVILNLTVGLAIGFTLIFAAVLIGLGPQYVGTIAGIQGSALGLYVLAFYLGSRWRVAGTVFTYVVAAAQASTGTLLFGREGGVHTLLFVIAGVAAPLFGARRWLNTVVAAAGATAAYWVVHVSCESALLPLGETRTRILFIASVVATTTCIAAIAWLFDWEILRSEERLEEERQRSERLLRNILPAPIAEELKSGSKRIARHFPEVTVLFADLVGFTEIAAQRSAESVVDSLDALFSEFDEVVAREGLEKIKTIGDAYMLAGGVPTPRDDHDEAVARAAVRLLAVMADHRGRTGEDLHIRIGIHTGPLIAGVIGSTKLHYDLWGDTVNTASRLESHGVQGKIHVSTVVYERLKDRFEFEERGPVSIKGKGGMNTWFLLPDAPELRGAERD